MKPIFKIAALLLTLMVTPGCEAKGLISFGQSEVPAAQTVPSPAPQYKLNGTPIPASLPIGNFPLDGQVYQANLLEVQQAWNSRNPGRFVGLPSGVSDSGYPVWPAVCNFTEDGAQCRLLHGGRANELDIARGVSVMRNQDVAMNPYVTCGFTLCVNQEGYVLGYISKEMQLWMKRNCNWDEVAIATCPYVE